MTKEFDLKLQKGNLNKSVLGHPSIYMSLSVNKHERIVGQLYSWFKTIIAIVISTTKHMNTRRVFLFISGSGSGKADINSLTWPFHLRQHENRNQPQVFVCERTQLRVAFMHFLSSNPTENAETTATAQKQKKYGEYSWESFLRTFRFRKCGDSCTCNSTKTEKVGEYFLLREDSPWEWKYISSNGREHKDRWPHDHISLCIFFLFSSFVFSF